MHINIGFGYAFPFNGIAEAENEGYSIPSAYEELDVKPTHADTSFIFFTDLAPFDPFILGNEAHALKIGVRGGYRFNNIKQSLITKASKNKEKEWGGTLMDYDRWMIGPVLHYAPVIQAIGMGGDYSAMGGLTFFVMFGQFVDGTLTAYPAKRKNVKEMNRTGTNVNNITYGKWKSDFSGYAIDIGIGGEISVGMVNLGINLTYTYLSIHTSREIYESLGKDSSMNEISLEFYVGIPIEWW